MYLILWVSPIRSLKNIEAASPALTSICVQVIFLSSWDLQAEAFYIYFSMKQGLQNRQSASQ